MTFKKIYSSLRTPSLIAGIALLVAGAYTHTIYYIGIGIALCTLSSYIAVVMKRQLKEQSLLILEALRNHDYSFRLPTQGHTPTEKILQNTFNQLSEMIAGQKQHIEQQEQFYKRILSCINSGIIVLKEDNSILQTNPTAAKLLKLPVLHTLNQLERYGENIPQLFYGLLPGKGSNIHFGTPKGEVQLLVRASAMQLGNSNIRILTLNDIRNEMDNKELDSWIKLTRVLTHEIMNSIAPISSLSETFLKRDDVIHSSLYEGIRAIHDTSAGLISFVDSYRKFSSLQQPSPEPFYISELVKQIEELHLIPPHISFTRIIEPSELMLYADPNLIRQVLLNLIKNAVQAIGKASGKIHLHAYSTTDEHIFIYLSNNGPSIPENEADEIFVPFFTTKKDGNGIGLSLSRQIMKLSGGTISLLKSNAKGWNTTFVLEFE